MDLMPVANDVEHRSLLQLFGETDESPLLGDEGVDAGGLGVKEVGDRLLRAEVFNGHRKVAQPRVWDSLLPGNPDHLRFASVQEGSRGEQKPHVTNIH